MRSEVLEAMLPWLGSDCGFGNASTLYFEGRQARAATEGARAEIALAIGAKPTELVFCSGGTEADHACITGIATALRTTRALDKGNRHIVCASFEHHAVLEPVRLLKRLGYDVTILNPDCCGFITEEQLAASITSDTALVAIMLAQNEIGTIQPLSCLVQVVRKASLAMGHKVYIHTDAVQALGKMQLNMRSLDVDTASFSAHKIGGPKGIGAFYLKSGTPFSAPMRGGGQEGGRRGGTQNVAGAIGFATAVRIACNPVYMQEENARICGFRDRIIAELVSGTGGTYSGSNSGSDNNDGYYNGDYHNGGSRNGKGIIRTAVPIKPSDTQNHLSNIVPLLVAGTSSEMLTLRLDEAGFAVSAGSACSTGSLEPSHVLLALGLGKDQANTALRISLGHASSKADIDALLAFLKGYVS
jgi:cysteine desulfurase